MEAGEMYNLTVLRTSDLGYILGDKIHDEEVLLHINDCGDEKPQVGDTVRVFLYFDHKRRVAATTFVPKITVFDCDWVEVKAVMPFGVFVDIGIRKDILYSCDDLPEGKNLWPQIGDLVYGYLQNDNNKGLLFKPGTRDDFLDIKIDAPNEIYGTKITARVVRVGLEGLNVFSDEGYYGFVHRSEYKEPARLGALVTGRVINVKDNGEINLSLIPQKELAIKDDKSLILDYITNHGGKMPLGDSSSPEDIKKVLGISKAAFKRALGALMKERLIYQNRDKTVTSQNVNDK